jgi:hypothetical protein
MSEFEGQISTVQYDREVASGNQLALDAFMRAVFDQNQMNVN